MLHSFYFAGFGGQGIMFAGQLLAYAAMDQGFNATWIPSYGPEMRGGTAYCQVVVSDKMIGSPVVKHPEIGVIFNGPSFEKFEPLIAPAGLLVYNASLIEQTSQRADITTIGVRATDLASELGNLQTANMVMLGAVVAARPIISMDTIKRVLETHLSARRRDMLETNYAALERGAAVAHPVA